MIQKQLNKIFSSIKNKEYDILSAEYKTQLEENPYKPVFEYFNFNNNNSNVFIIYGENASGKSVITKIIKNRLMDKNIETREVSMQERTTSGVKRAFLIGDDATQSTGETSFTFLNKAFGGMQKEDKDRLSLTIFDEPDLGLSTRYARALGRYFSEEQSKLNDNKAIIIISHNIEFIKAFIKDHKANVSTLGVNTQESFEHWLNDDSEHSIEELIGLTKLGRAKHSGIEKKQIEIREKR